MVTYVIEFYFLPYEYSFVKYVNWRHTKYNIQILIYINLMCHWERDKFITNLVINIFGLCRLDEYCNNTKIKQNKVPLLSKKTFLWNKSVITIKNNWLLKRKRSRNKIIINDMNLRDIFCAELNVHLQLILLRLSHSLDFS